MKYSAGYIKNFKFYMRDVGLPLPFFYQKSDRLYLLMIEITWIEDELKTMKEESNKSGIKQEGVNGRFRRERS